LTPTERRQVDNEAVNEVLASQLDNKRTISKNKNADDPNIYQPVGSPRMSPKQFEDAIRQKSGANTPVQNKMFDKVGGGVTKGVMNKLV